MNSPNIRDFRPSSFVVPKVTKLQSGYQNDNSSARAVLAQLRQASSGESGTAWEISEYLVPELDYPEWSMQSDATKTSSADRIEIAIHISMTTYARLQQGKPNGMHVPKRSLGTAAKMLAAHRDEPMDTGKVWERFSKLAQAETVSSLRWQLRGLTSLLHRRGIGFDIGRLADDLLFWQIPSTKSNVQRAWSRAYFSASASHQTEASTTSVSPE